MLSPQALLELAGGGQLPAGASAWPAGRSVSFHSGRFRPGDVFFALPGASGHGLDYASAVLDMGASFLVSDRPHPRGLQVDDPAGLLLKLGRKARSQISGTVIGITGSAGKTTTKDLLRSLLAAGATPGNLNTPLALSCTLVEAALHSPRQDLVLELGIDHPGEMATLLDLTSPELGVLTSIAPSHLQGLGSLEAVRNEKRQLTDRASRSYLSVQAAGQLTDLPAGSITYGLETGADRQGSVQGGRLHFEGFDWPLAQPGRAYATNLTGALSVAIDLGVRPELLRERLAGASLTPGRLQLRQAGRRLLIDDSYNSNPASAQVALEVLREQPGPRVAILGDMRELGAESDRYHHELGLASRGLDLVIAVGEHAAHVRAGNPRAVTVGDTMAALPLLGRLPEPATVLIKASRSLGFERLVQALEEST